MVTVLAKDDTWGDVGRQAGENLVKGYTNRSDEMAIQKAVEGLPQDATPRQILDAVTKVKTFNPESKQTALKNYVGAAEYEETVRKAKATEAESIRHHQALEGAANQRNDIAAGKKQKKEDEDAAKKAAKIAEDQAKINKEKQTTANLVSLIPDDKMSPEQKADFIEKATPEVATFALKESLKPDRAVPQSIFDKKLENHYADEFIEIGKQLPVYKDNLANIDLADNLIDKLGVTRGIKGLFGNEDVAFLNSLQLPIIQPVIKLFNPSGPLAQKKLEQLTDIFTIKPWDLPGTAKGKMKGMRLFALQGTKRMEDRQKLIREYIEKGKSAELEDKIRVHDEESKSIMDSFLNYNTSGEEVNIKGFPPADSVKPGKTIKGPDGTVYYSDGFKWYKP